MILSRSIFESIHFCFGGGEEKPFGLTFGLEREIIYNIKLFPFTWWIVAVGVLMHGFIGVLMVLNLPDRVWEHWVDTVGAMIFGGALYGLALALLGIGFEYLYLKFSRPGQRRIFQRINPA